METQREEKKKIVVFGGSFNPPLDSHFSLAQQIVTEYEEVEKVVFVPVNSLYTKVGLIENEHRYAMLKLVCDKNPNFVLSDVEIASNSPCYTIETLEKIQKQYPDYTIWFMIGSDNLKLLSSWKKAEELAEYFKVLVLERDQDCMDKIIEQDSFLKKYATSFQKAKNSVRSNLSSTFVREKLKRGKSIRYLLPEEVYQYIIDHQLFR